MREPIHVDPKTQIEDVEASNLEQFTATDTGGRHPTVAADGTLSYLQGATVRKSRMLWVDRRGESLGTIGEPLEFLYPFPDISPDGKSILVAGGEGDDVRQIWLYDSETGVRRKLTFDELKAEVSAGRIDTVVAAQIDMQGRLMGKRFQANFFIDSAWEETHSCNYLLATDMEMFTVDSYEATSWAAGCGDYTMRPDLSTLRRVPWLEGTALVLCDVLDHHTHDEVAHSPRAVLKRQIKRLSELGYRSLIASELEFFLFRNSYEEIADGAAPDRRRGGPHRELPAGAAPHHQHRVPHRGAAWRRHQIQGDAAHEGEVSRHRARGDRV